MITDTDSLEDEHLIREGEAAVEEYGRSIDRACDQIIPMARITGCTPSPQGRSGFRSLAGAVSLQ